MRSASNEFITLAQKEYGARYYHKIFSDGVEVTDSIDNFALEHWCNSDDVFSFGNTCSARIEFTINSPSLELEGKELDISEGIKLSDGTIEYIPIGKFKVMKPIVSRGVYTYECYDRMVSLMDTAYFSKLSYPTTDIAILQEICSEAGIQLANADSLISHEIDRALLGYLKREIIGYLAQLQGKNAIINSDGNLELIWYTETDYVVDDDKIYENGEDIVNSENDYTLGYLECEVTSADGTTTTTIKSGSGSVGISFSNPYMTQAILDEVFAKIGNFAFRSVSVQFLGDFRLEVGDIVTVETYGSSYKAPIMQVTHNSDGGVVTTIQSIAETSENNSVNTLSPTVRQLNRFYGELVLINQAMVNKLSVDDLDAVSAEIKEAVIGELSADFVTTDRLEAEIADIETLIAGKLSANELSAEVAKLGYVTASQVSANYATIEQLNATNATVSGKLSASEADLKYATIENVETNYADIKLANVAIADIGTLFAEVGLITSATIVDGHVTGYLDAVEVNANKITAGTLAVDRLIFRGSENSIVYELNNITGALQAVQGNTLNGEILTDRSITVDKIVANSITANEIASGAITANELATNAVTADKILANAITTAKIASGAITSDKIEAGAITAEKLNVNNLGSISAEIGKLKIDENGILTSTFEHTGDIVEEGSLIDDYIKIDYTYMASSINDYKYVAGTTKVGFEDFELNRADTYKTPHEMLFNKVVKVDEGNVKYSAKGISWKTTAYDEDYTMITETTGNINFGTTISSSGGNTTRVSVCEFDFYKLSANRLEISNNLTADYGSFNRLYGGSVRTTAGADLDDINSNLTLNEVTDVTFTKTGGACNVTTFKVRKRGNEIMFRITIRSTATVASASNLLEGTINKYKPIDVYTAGSFSGGTSIGAVVYADGRVNIRVHGGVSLSSGSVVNIGFNYLTAE